MLKFLVAPVILLLLSIPAAAHKRGDSYIYMKVSDDALIGRFEVHFADLAVLFDLDRNGDGMLAEAEVESGQNEIYEYLSKRLTIRHSGDVLPLSQGEFGVLDLGLAGNYAQIEFDIGVLDVVPDEIDMLYQPLTDVSPGHKGLIGIEDNTRVGLEGNETYISLTFSAGEGFKTLSLGGEPLGKLIGDFVVKGIWHLWMGAGHILFLIAILLSSVMVAAGSRWAPTEDFTTGILSVAKVVAIFALGSSITLILVVMGIASLPESLVDAAVAASIIVVAVMNIFPALQRLVPWAVFGFGLFHGFGFATGLHALSLDPIRQVLGTLGFDLGIVIGMLAIVFVAFPVLWVLRRLVFYPFLAFRFATFVMVVVAGNWFVEHALGYEVNMRALIKSVTGIQL